MWIEFNPSPTGRRVGDCSVRAMELEDMMRNAPTEQERMKYQRMLDEM